MKLTRTLLLSFAIVVFAAAAQADTSLPNDPRIKTGGGGGGSSSIPSPFSVPAGIIVTNFTISSATGTSPGTSPCVLNQNGIMTTSPACLFENDITVNGAGLTIAQLIFDMPNIDPETVNCGFLVGSPFAECGVDPLAGGGTEVTFFGGSIPFHSDFTLDFEGFPKNQQFGGTASPVPEPCTLAMLVGGLGTLLARRRSRVR